MTLAEILATFPVGSDERLEALAAWRQAEDVRLAAAYLSALATKDLEAIKRLEIPKQYKGLASSILDPILGGASRDLVDAAMLILTILIRPHGLFGRHDIERV